MMTDNEVTVKMVEEIAGVVPQSHITNILDACQRGKGSLYSRVNNVIENIVAEGWSAGSIIMQVCL
jgi:replication factor C subunit 2/4